LQIRHRRVLASGPESVSGFLCVCLVIGGGREHGSVVPALNMGLEERFSKWKRASGEP
jgi:hypothetical protein